MCFYIWPEGQTLLNKPLAWYNKITSVKVPCSLCWSMHDPKIISVCWIVSAWQKQIREASNVYGIPCDLTIAYICIYIKLKKNPPIHDSSDLCQSMENSQQTFMHGNTQLSKKHLLPITAILPAHLQGGNLPWFQWYFWRQDRYIPKVIWDECT